MIIIIFIDSLDIAVNFGTIPHPLLRHNLRNAGIYPDLDNALDKIIINLFRLWKLLEIFHVL